MQTKKRKMKDGDALVGMKRRGSQLRRQNMVAVGVCPARWRRVDQNGLGSVDSAEFVVVRLELESEESCLEQRLDGSGSLCDVAGCSTRNGGSVRCAVAVAVAVAAAAAEGRRTSRFERPVAAVRG